MKMYKPVLLLVLAGILFTTSLSAQKADLLSKVRADDIDGVKALIAAGANVNQEDDMMGYTALSLTQNTELMKVLISAGADINHRAKRTGYTPLMNALNSNNTALAKFFINQGADFKIKADDGTSALILACGCSEDIAKDLLAKGADINVLSDKGNGVITQCANLGLTREVVSYEFIEFLLSKGAEIDEVNTTDYYGGYTPLFWAVEDNNKELVSFLVKHGANVNAKSNKGKTPLSIANEAGYTGIAEILKKAGAK
ncbi:MAG TPA: ankyrin repeat domain-containing protein [Bacteroidales bacterium]|nr:ankyrin repeat domain-containing protein [Bacteroidales bacterium]HPJ60442.1 ankyrin repeat domain-containing protein [Bacteroidales bacterium]